MFHLFILLKFFIFFRLFDKSSVFILPVTLFSICWNIPKFFELKTCYFPIDYENNETNTQIRNISKQDGQSEKIEVLPQVCATELRDSYTYCRDYLLISNFILMAFIPFILLLFLNSLTFRSIRISTINNSRTTNRQRRDHRIAKMFTVIVLIFFLCNTPRMILNIWEVSWLPILFYFNLPNYFVL